MKNPKELFESIVKLSKEALSNDTVKEEVVLSEEVVEEEVVLAEENKEAVEEKAPVSEESVAAPVQQHAAVSKSEFDSAIAEIKEMYTKVLESISPSQPLEVPQALSEVTEEAVEEVELSTEEPTEEVKEEVNLSEEVVNDELVHDPESEVTKKRTILYAQTRTKTTQDHVFNQLFNKN